MNKTKYIVTLKMQDTTDCVRDYTKEIKCDSLKDARMFLRELEQNPKNAFKTHSIGFFYDYVSHHSMITKRTISNKLLWGVKTKKP